MARLTKTGSSRRKGDEFQDLTALQLILETYIEGDTFQVYIEYDEAGALDDVVVVLPDRVEAYQAKHAVKENAVYVASDLTDEKSVVFIEKFAKGWKKLLNKFPDRKITTHLRSNRTLDSTLAEIVTSEGFFDIKFLENRYRNEKRKLRSSILKASGLNEAEFYKFISSFHFDLKQPSWLALETHIKGVLLDHKLGISDRRIFADLKRLVEEHAIVSFEPITTDTIGSFFNKTQTRYLLPQSFFVDDERFVKQLSFEEQLDNQLLNANGEYVVVTGSPGSGKSTSLTKYCDNLEINKDNLFFIVRYYCFVRTYDNSQKLRLEAKSLRVNLLNELQESFPKALNDRRFDISENRFYEALVRVAEYCQAKNKKLIMLIDGLDHVERDEELRDSVIAALPAKIPENIVILIGTQELNKWTPIALKEGRKNRHVTMPLFTEKEVKTYVIKRCGMELRGESIYQIYKKSSGLPLYLRYLTELIEASDNYDTAINDIPAAVGGDVRIYYESIWASFKSKGWSDAKFLCSVLAGLEFDVHEDELFSFQEGIPDIPRYEDAYHQVRHLLRKDNSLISIFHDSFRVFIFNETKNTTKEVVSLGIFSRLQQEEMQSSRWFKYSMSYAISAKKYQYILENINPKFVDEALMRFRPYDDILSGIECAIEAASTLPSLSELSRLGCLKYSTHERLDCIFPKAVMSDVLLYEGRIGQVVDSLYSEESNKITADDEYTLHVILKLVELHNNELARKLFNEFMKDINNVDLDAQKLKLLAQCLGAFTRKPIRAMRWLANIKLERQILEPEELALAYAPHLAAYFDSLVSNGRVRVCNRLKQVESKASEQLIRQFIIRATAKYGGIDELRSELEDYIEKFKGESNLELALYASKAVLPIDLVNQLAGQFDFPLEVATNKITRTELQNQILKFSYWAVIFGYGQNRNVLKEIRQGVRGSNAVLACAQLHLLKVGEVLGCHYAGREIDWFSYATEAIEFLELAGHSPGERTPDALDAVRSILKQSLSWLSEVLVKRSHDKLSEWGLLLKRLRSSFIWTTHYGFGESETNYFFEFPIWEEQSDLSEMQSKLRPIFLDCAKSYDDALSLKGGSRGEHFLTLAALAAKCGFRTDSSLWLERGVETSLAYGYRKDVTLELLIDVLTILGKYRPQKVLSGAASILEMIKWVHSATDGRSTKHFAQYLLPTIVKYNRSAGLDVLRVYYKEFASWQADESVQNYILARDSGDPEYLWALCGVLDPNESLKVRNHVVALAVQVNPEVWKQRLSTYTKTMVNPRHWPDELWKKVATQSNMFVRKKRYEHSEADVDNNSTYTLDGRIITESEVRELCGQSFRIMLDTFEKLKKENDYVSEYCLLSELTSYIENVSSGEELNLINSFVKELGHDYGAKYLEKIGHKYLSLGDISKGLECLELAIQGNLNSEALGELTQYDKQRAENFFIKEVSKRLQGGSYQAFSAPKIIATACDIFKHEEILEQVFDDYLLHCQQLFAQWPSCRAFDELRDWGHIDKEEETQVVNLLVDRLGTHASELANRLISSICLLAETRGDKVLPILTERLIRSEGLLLWRLVQVFTRLSYSSRTLFKKHCHKLTPLLECKDTFVVIAITEMIKCTYVDNIQQMPNEIYSEIEKISRRYSSVIAYREFRLLKTTPSDDFIELTKRAVPFAFRRQLETICQILGLDLESVTAYLERQLLETGTNLAKEKEIAMSMSNAFSHAQGWPIIWFISDLHVQLCSFLYQLVDETLTKNRYHSQYVEAVWRVIQSCDPEYSYSELISIPDDISPLSVLNKDSWIAHNKNTSDIMIEEELADEWVTVFEYRELAQDTLYHAELMSQTHVRSAVVKPEVINDISSIASNSWNDEVVTHHPEENLTWRQFREALCNGCSLDPDVNEAFLSFTAQFKKKSDFQGFYTIASLSAVIIKEEDLLLEGYSVFANGERVAYFEAWQEGYSDEDYRDEPLSFGVRLRVSSKFIKEVCQKMERAFVIQTIENRFVMENYKHEPKQSASYSSTRIWPINAI